MKSDRSVSRAGSWQSRIIEFVEATANFLFYSFALLILIVPPLKWLGDLIPSTDNVWWVLVALVVFGILIPAFVPLFASYAIELIRKMRDGEFFPLVFRPFKSITAVAGIFGVLQLEYYAIHDRSDTGLVEIVVEFFKAM